MPAAIAVGLFPGSARRRAARLPAKIAPRGNVRARCPRSRVVRAFGVAPGGRAAYAAAAQRRAGRGVARQKIKYEFPRVSGCGAAPVTVHTRWRGRGGRRCRSIALGAGTIGMIAEAAHPAGHEAGAASRRAIRAGIAAGGAEPHARSWIVGFYGGNDSAVAVHPVVERLLSLPSNDWRRPCVAGDSDRSRQRFGEFAPLLDFRRRVVSIRNRLHRRLALCRNGICNCDRRRRHCQRGARRSALRRKSAAKPESAKLRIAMARRRIGAAHVGAGYYTRRTRTHSLRTSYERVCMLTLDMPDFGSVRFRRVTGS